MRNELSVEAETDNFEYVLVFDDSAFVMKSINRILKTKNIKGPAMVTKCQRLTHINEHADRKLAVLLVSADDSVVYQQAQKMQLMVKLRSGNRYEAFDCANTETFEPLGSKEYNKVVLSMMKAQIDVDSLVHEGTISELFPLHRTTGQQELYENWVYNSRSSPAWLFPPFSFIGDLLFERNRNRFSELTICYNYLGATHALYFG